MQKNLLLVAIGFLLSVSGSVLHAQFLTENFETAPLATNWDAATLPSGTWTRDPLFVAANPTAATAGTKTWIIEAPPATAPANWNTRHARFNWTPSITNYALAIISPTIDLTTANVGAYLRYELGNDGFSTANDHFFEIWVSSNGGTNWTLAQSIGDAPAVPFPLTIETVTLSTALPSMVGSATCRVAFVLQGVGSTAGIDNWHVDNIVVENPPTTPQLLLASGTAFNATRTYDGAAGVALANASLLASDSNDPTLSVTITSSNPVPGVTTPANQVAATVPHTLTWTGTPSGAGTFTYTVTLDDGTTSVPFTVTFVITPPLVQFGTLGVGNTIPFNQTSIRYQNSYGASELNLPAGTVIREVRVAGGVLAPPVYNNLRLRMAHSTLAVNALTNTFANNFSGTLETVLGPVNITPNVAPITGSTTVQWYIFPLSTPFVYNGVDALLVDWSYDSKVGTGFAVSITTPGGEPARSRVYATSGNYLTPTSTATAATGGSYGVQIHFLPTNSVVISGAAGATDLAAPQNDVVMMQLSVGATTTARTLTSLTITKSGSVSDGQVSLVRLVLDVNGDGLVDGGDTILSSGTLTAGQITFTGSPLAIVPDLAVNPATRLLVAANFTSALPIGATLGFAIASTGAVTFSGGTDYSSYPISSGALTQRMSGTYTINQTSGDFTDIGDAFDALEANGVSGPVILSITDSATYVADASYTLGMNSATDQALQVLTPVAGASATNTITLRAAPGQNPKVQGNASGAVLWKYAATTAQTGRGGLAINQSFVTVEGLEVFGGPHFGIMTQGNGLAAVLLAPTNITIRRCTVYNVPNGPGIAFMGMNSGWATNYLVEHNFVYNCVTAGLTSTPTLQTTTNGCIVVRNPDFAATGAIVRHNTVVHTSTVANTAGIYINNSSGARQMGDMSNNIVVVTNSTTVAALFLNTAAHAPATANFNYWNATTHCNLATHTPFATWQGLGYDANGSNASPQLLSTSAPFDLRLSPTSPCIDPTGQTSTATIDIFGTTRPQGTAVDIGAHEANWVAGLSVAANLAGPATVTSALATDQWVGTFNATSVLSIQQVNSVMFTHIGTTGNSSYANLKIWIDANANGTFDGADVQLGTTVAALTGSTVTFSGTPLGQYTAQNQSATFFLTAQIAASATLGTARFQVTAASDISATTGPVNGTFPVIGRSIDVINPAPTLTPGTGSGFNASRVISVLLGTGLTNAFLTAGDSNNSTLGITIVPISAAPGVTQPSNQVAAAVPATLTWTGTPTAVGTYTYDVTLSDGTNSPNFTVTINVTNPAPTLVPGTGSGFNAARVYSATMGDPLVNAVLVASDANDPTVSITITAVSAAPGVTQPSDQPAASVPANLTWTGTPTSVGSFTYSVVVSDGVNNPSFTVTINVSNPAPTLVPATGSAFSASRVYSATMGTPLANAVLTANDLNDSTVDITITAVSAAPGVTQPSNQPAAAVPANITWTGTPTVAGSYTYTVNIADGTNSPNFTVTINVVNPAPTLVPATGSAFSATRVYAALTGVPLANAVLTANDANDASVAIVITSTTPAPGVTAPANNPTATVPFNLTWTGTPTTVGSYTYTVNIADGDNTPNFTVTINVTNPAPTLVPATGSAFNAARTYAGLKNTALANAVLTANDANEPTVAITITAVTAAPGVTQPANNPAATVPFDLTWTGTPTSHGTFTYTVTVSDGVNTPQNFTVTFNIAHPALSGTYTISQTLTADFTNIGEAFDILESVGVTGAVVLEIIDSATYPSTASYGLGGSGTATTVMPIGLSATNTLTIRAAAGQTPVISGSATADPYTGAATGTMAFRNVGNITLEGLTITGGSAFGVMFYSNVNGSSNNITVRNCRIHGITLGAAIFMYDSGATGAGPHDVLIENNVIWNVTGDTTWAGGDRLGVLGSRRPGTNFRIRHNSIHLNSASATANVFFTTGASALAEVSYNTVYVGGSASCYRILTASAPTVADRNVIFLDTLAAMSNVTGQTTFATWQGGGRDVNSVNANPMFVNIGTGTEDLHLQASSPAIDLAVGSALTTDFDGNTRPAGRAADAGAFEAQVPEIEVLQATTTVNYNTSFSVGNVSTAGGTFTFTIENNGVTDLILSGTPTVQATIISNLDPASGVTVQPALTTVAASGSTTFDVFLDPTINLAFSISISIANNDSDRAPFIFTITGTGFTPNGDAEASTATGSSFTGGTNGPFSMAVNPGTVLANASIQLTDPESDNITVTAITATTTLPAGITAPAIPAVGQPLTLTWTGTANASNAPGAYTWQVTFQDAGSGTPVSVFVTITINDVPPAHVILNATGGNGGAGNPYTGFWTATQNAGAIIDMATVTDANTSQVLSLGTIIPGGANPAGGSGFTIALTAGLLRVSPAAALVAADVGVHTFNVQVTDGSNNINIHLSLTVSAAPNITTVSPLTDGEQGVSYTALQFVATGGTGSLTWTVTGGALPSGMTLTGAGLFSGIPALAGVYNFDLTATDSVGVFDTAAFQITVDPPAAGNPTITTTSPLLGGIVGNAYGPVTITAAGGTPGYSFSIVSGSLPAGLTMSAAGVITGTPSVQGTATFDVRVTDTAFATDTDTFSITIASVPTSGGGGGGGGGGCAAEGSSTSTLWGLLLGMPALMYLARRRRAARK